MKAAPVFPYTPPRKSYIDFVQLSAADVIKTAARIPAHSHSQPERVTVLSGTLYLGIGDGSDAGAAIPLSAGSYSSMPPKMMHFGWMKGETILQLSSIGPWTVTYVNPNDDPRKASK
jgi:hypothetical protein